MNKVILVGRISKDPDVRYTQSQMAVARFTVAVDRPKQKDGNSNQPTADFIGVTAFGKAGEIIERFFSKGKWILVEGRIQNNNYEDKHGNMVYSDQIIADKIEFVGNKSDGAQGSNREAPPQRNSYDPQDQDTGIPEGFSALEDDDMPF